MSRYRYWQADTGTGAILFRTDATAPPGQQVAIATDVDDDWEPAETRTEEELLANLSGLVREIDSERSS